MKATAVPAVEHTASSPAVHTGKQGNTAFFGPAAGNEAPFFAPRIQTKLTIGRPGDKYEQEADTVADRVVQRLANPGPPVAVQKKCQDCEEKEKLQRKEKEEEREAPEVMRKEAEEEEEAPPVQAKEKEEEEKPGLMRQAGPEEEESLQAKAAPEGAAAPSPSLESRLSSAKGTGAPMDKNTRQPMEAAFGQDFSRVRIHTDSSSAQMNRELNARAFTHGRDIYFNAGEYSPGSTEGRRLLAHELSHTIQQRKLPKKIQKYPQYAGVSYSPEINPAHDDQKKELGETLLFINGLESSKILRFMMKSLLFPLPSYARIAGSCFLKNRDLNVNIRSLVKTLAKPPWRKTVNKAYLKKFLRPSELKRFPACNSEGTVTIIYRGIPSDLQLRADVLFAEMQHARDHSCLFRKFIIGYQEQVNRLRNPYASTWWDCSEPLDRLLQRDLRLERFTKTLNNYSEYYDAPDGAHFSNIRSSIPNPNTCDTIILDIQTTRGQTASRNCKPYLI